MLLKTREDFKSEDEYRKYTKTSDFLEEYSWKGKAREQIIQEMALPDYEQELLEEAMGYCGAKGEYSGIELDRHILLLLDLGDHPEGERIRSNLKKFYERKGDATIKL